MSRTMTSARPRPRLRACCMTMGVLVPSTVFLALAGWRTGSSESFTPVAGLPLVILLVGMVPLGWQMVCGVSPEIAGTGWALAISVLSVLALAVSIWALASPTTSVVDYIAAGVNVVASVLALGRMHAFSVSRSLAFGRP